MRRDDLVLDVCICTHNPRRDVFALVIHSIANQDADKSKFRVIIVDNASTPALGRGEFKDLDGAGIEFRILLEPRLGNVFARAAAIAASTSDWVLFVDDDNELAPDYISHGMQVIGSRPELGCFGGRLELPSNIVPPRWMLPLLPYLAVRDFGDAEITKVADFWGEWEPATAGGFVRRSVLELYIDRIKNDEKVHQLGRKGKRSLNSGEDSLMMWGARKLGLAASYQPGLRLNHHINPDRFRFWYFFRLMRGYGRSNAILDKLYSRAGQVMPLKTLARRFLGNARSKPWRCAICLAAYDAAYNAELSKP
jgi:glycosyltransferase involved in cell wall biosynthesis